MDLTVKGEDFFHLSKRMKAAGGDHRKMLNKAVREPAKKIIPATRASARSGKLPDKGGLAKRVAKAPQRVQVRTGETTAGVRVVVGGKGSAARTLDQRGSVRHPTFGRGRFVEQRVPGAQGWFSEPADRLARTEVRDEVVKAMEDFARTLRP